MTKASDLQIKECYENLKSCKKVAEKLGMCSQSIHERLVKMGLNKSINFLTDLDKKQIEELYKNGFKKGDGKQKNLALSIGRTPQFISRYAKTKGLTNSKRKCDQIICEAIGIRTKKNIEENGHPKGMLGKKHSETVVKNMKQRLKEWHENASDEVKQQKYDKMVASSRERGVFDHSRGSWKSAWRIIGGKKKFFRSRWEANYARYLELLKIQGKITDWFHEPETFWFKDIKRGTRSYLPDFKVIELDGTHKWIEVKGWMDAKSKTKLKRFAKYYPKEKMELVQAKWFKDNSKSMQNIISDWET